MSDSVRPHRRKPARLPRPWDSPGKNTGVGCHFLLQCMKMKSERKVSQSCLTLSEPMDPYQAPLSMGFSRQEYWSVVPLPSPIYLYNGIIVGISKEGDIHATTWMNCEHIIQSGRSQAQNVSYILHVYQKSRIIKSTETENRLVVGRSWSPGNDC